MSLLLSRRVMKGFVAFASDKTVGGDEMMEALSIVRGTVRMLSDYVRIPLDRRAAIPGSGPAQQALRMVEDTLKMSGRDPTVFDLFQKDPDTYEEPIVKWLVRLTSENPDIAERLNDLLSDFHCMSARSTPVVTVAKQGGAKYGGIEIGPRDVTVSGDINSFNIGGETHWK